MSEFQKISSNQRVKCEGGRKGCRTRRPSTAYRIVGHVPFKSTSVATQPFFLSAEALHVCCQEIWSELFLNWPNWVKVLSLWHNLKHSAVLIQS